MAFLRKWLAHPKLGRYLAAIAVLLTLPALFHGYEVDDRLQRIKVLRHGKFAYLAQGVDALYTFIDGDPKLTAALIEAGIATWWSDVNARIAFLRPITSFNLWLDHRYVNVAWLSHLQSVVWYLGTIFVALALYRRLIQRPWVAGLAALMFTVDHTHGLAAAWIAQRNTLIAGLFGLLTLYFHDRARRDAGREREAFFAATCLGLALFSAEGGLGVLPYLLAHAWFFDRERFGRSLWPYAPPVLVWALVYKLGGYGTHGSGMYVDPGDAPLSYFSQTLHHAPLLVATELGMPGVDFYPFLPAYAKIALVTFAVVGTTMFLITIRPLLRQNAESRFFVLSGLLSILPACATLPSGRLTFLCSFGLLGALAQIIEAWRDPASWFPRQGWIRLCAIPVVLWCGLGHLFLSPIAFVFSMHQMTIFEKIVARLAQGLPNDPKLESQRMIVVNPPEPAFCAYVMVVRSDDGLPTPRGMLSMSSGARPLELKRIDDSTLILSSQIGLVQPGVDLLARDNRPFVVGETVKFSDLSIEVTRVGTSGWPLEAKFMFAKPLENESYTWMQWKDQTLVPLTLPKVGETLSFPAQVIQLL